MLRYPEGKHPFQYQRPGPKAIAAIERIRRTLAAAYDELLDAVPESAERTLAARKLEEASMWANKAIAFHLDEPPAPDPVQNVQAFGGSTVSNVRQSIG